MPNSHGVSPKKVRNRPHKTAKRLAAKKLMLKAKSGTKGRK